MVWTKPAIKKVEKEAAEKREDMYRLLYDEVCEEMGAAFHEIVMETCPDARVAVIREV